MEVIYPPINFSQFEKKVYQWRSLKNLHFKLLKSLFMIQNEILYYCFCDNYQGCIQHDYSEYIVNFVKQTKRLQILRKY